MEIILVGTRDYSWAVNIFAHQFNQHWDTVPVTWWGDKKPSIDLPRNFEWKQVPAYKEGVWDWTHWFGNGLISILNKIVDDIVCIFLPDHWISAQVDKEAVCILNEYMKAHPDCLRGNLTRGTCLDGYGQVLEKRFDLEIVSVPPNHAHCAYFGGMTFAPGLWNRKNLLRVLEPHWSLWAAESVGTQRVLQKHVDLYSVGTRPGALTRVHGLVHSRENEVDVRGFSERDKRKILPMIPERYEVRDWS